MSRVSCDTNIAKAIKERNNGLLLNPHRFGGAAPGFTDPNSIAGLKLWIDPSDGGYRSITSGAFDSVTCKKSGIVYAQATTANKPALGAIGSPFSLECMDFGILINKWLYNVTGVTFTNPAHIFIVAYFANRSSTSSCIGLYKGNTTTAVNGSTGYPFYIIYTAANGTANLQSANNGTNYLYGLSILPKSTKGLIEFRNSTTPVLSSLYKDQLLQTKSAAGTTMTGASNVINHFGSQDTTYVVNGAMGEILAYEGVLSGANITSISNYLKARWGTP